MTALDLLSLLTDRGHTVTADGPNLAITPDPPADLDPAIAILAVPMLAIVTGRRLYAIDANGRGCTRPDGIADPSALLPASVRLMAVGGLTEWDRVSPHATEAYPHLFAPTAKAGRGAA